MHRRIITLLGIAYLVLAGACATVPEPSPAVSLDVKKSTSGQHANDVSLAVIVAQRGPEEMRIECSDEEATLNPPAGTVGNLLARQIADRGFRLAAPRRAVAGDISVVVRRPHDCGEDLAPLFESCAADVLLVGEAVVSSPDADSGPCSAEVSLAAYRRADRKRLFTVYTYVDGSRVDRACDDVIARLSREAADEVLGRLTVEGREQG